MVCWIERCIFLNVINHPISIDPPKDRISFEVSNQKMVYHTEWGLNIRTINRDIPTGYKFSVKDPTAYANIKQFLIT